MGFGIIMDGNAVRRDEFGKNDLQQISKTQENEKTETTEEG